MTISELGLTPTQLAELDNLDDGYVQAWLEALTVAKGIKNPTGWFLAGIRSGRHPADPPTDTTRDKQALLAETWIRNAGLYLPTEAELLDALFGPHGRLKAWASDDVLRTRMENLWQHERTRTTTEPPQIVRTDEDLLWAQRLANEPEPA